VKQLEIVCLLEMTMRLKRQVNY